MDTMENRREAICALVNERKNVTFAEIKEAFPQVSDMTIRTDLRVLDEKKRTSPSMASMLLKDRSGGQAWFRGTVLELNPHLGSTVSFPVAEVGKGSHLCDPRYRMETHWGWGQHTLGRGTPLRPGCPTLQAQPQLT